MSLHFLPLLFTIFSCYFTFRTKTNILLRMQEICRDTYFNPRKILKNQLIPLRTGTMLCVMSK